MHKHKCANGHNWWTEELFADDKCGACGAPCIERIESGQHQPKVEPPPALVEEKPAE